jgi:hypothetical protein
MIDGGPMGAGVRKPLPDCCVGHIREMLPSESFMGCRSEQCHRHQAISETDYVEKSFLCSCVFMAGARHLKVRAKVMETFEKTNRQASFQASRRVAVVLICSKNKFDPGSTLENAIFFFNFLLILLTFLFLARRH